MTGRGTAVEVAGVVVAGVVVVVVLVVVVDVVVVVVVVVLVVVEELVDVVLCISTAWSLAASEQPASRDASNAR